MIIRKPYAFLIKNFRKIHIFLLLLSIYVLYKLFDVSRFVNEFMRLGTYDLFNDPITRHINIILLLALFLLVIGSLALLFLLRHKGKPWKLYLVPAVEYFALIFVLSMIKNFFRNYTGDVETTDLRLSRDLLVIFIIVQLPAIGIYLMRIFGWDIKKFNFNADEEFLQLSEEDREEIEIGLDIDKNTFIRGYKRFIRNVGYVYQEHKGICKTILGIIVVIFGFSMYRFFFVTNKSYKEGDFYSVNGYTFKINNAYFTDKDYTGNVIESKSNFVVVDLTIKNNSEPRNVYLENFHIRNGINDFVTTNETYASEFRDLGTTYKSIRKLKRDEQLDCIIVYKVDKNSKKNRFVLYYQENGDSLRKIKLNVKDVSKIEDVVNLKLGEQLDLGFKNKNDSISIDNVNITDNITYTTRKKTSEGTTLIDKELTLNGDSRILDIEFASDVWEAKNMIDFLRSYGKLNYKDSEGREDTLKIENPVKEAYYGKSVYLKVPVELENAKEISFEFIIRNKHYIYKII